MDVLEDLGEADALFLGDVLLVRHVVAVVVAASWPDSSTQALLAPRLLRNSAIVASRLRPPVCKPRP